MLQSGEFTSYPGCRAALIGGRDWPGPSPWHRLYRCTDGWIGLAALTEQEIARVPRALRPHMDGHGGDGDGGAGDTNDDAWAATLTGVFAQMSVQEALDRLAARRIPAVSVLDRHDVFTDPWLLSNGYYHAVDDPVLGTCTCVSGFADWAGSPTLRRSRSFACGEDTAEVLAKVGLAGDEIGSLVASGAAGIAARPA
jgi:crotonobetainyl-CoA:carnitine CoA-transferase CaiB-like acyl-CoA transferase